MLPGGTPAAAQLHVCRTVCRRAERRTIDCGDEVNAECVRYLNRLSDLLFILSRGANLAVSGEEPLWEPGAGQSSEPSQGCTPPSTARCASCYAMARQLASHWTRLGGRLGGAPGEALARRRERRARAAARAGRAAPPRTGCTASRPRRASAGGSPALRNVAGDLVLERNQALRAAVLDVAHVTTLLAYLAALADRRGDAMLAAWHRRWEVRLREARGARDGDASSRWPRTPDDAILPASQTAARPRRARRSPTRSARSARRSTAPPSAAPRARSRALGRGCSRSRTSSSGGGATTSCQPRAPSTKIPSGSRSTIRGRARADGRRQRRLAERPVAVVARAAAPPGGRRRGARRARAARARSRPPRCPRRSRRAGRPSDCDARM